jgi:hypothetical protein
VPGLVEPGPVERPCQAVKWLDRYEPQGKAIGEENTKVGPIAPVLEALGKKEVADTDGRLTQVPGGRSNRSGPSPRTTPL